MHYDFVAQTDEHDEEDDEFRPPAAATLDNSDNDDFRGDKLGDVVISEDESEPESESESVEEVQRFDPVS